MTKVKSKTAGHDRSTVEEETMTIEEWLAIRREAALQIDPETAEVEWCYAQTPDPYGITPDLTEDCRQVGREYFACAPEATFGFGLVTCRPRHEMHCGESIDINWRFQRVWRN